MGGLEVCYPSQSQTQTRNAGETPTQYLQADVDVEPINRLSLESIPESNGPDPIDTSTIDRDVSVGPSPAVTTDLDQDHSHSQEQLQGPTDQAVCLYMQQHVAKLIDEFQDTSRAQEEMMRRLLCPMNKGLGEVQEKIVDVQKTPPAFDSMWQTHALGREVFIGFTKFNVF